MGGPRVLRRSAHLGVSPSATGAAARRLAFAALVTAVLLVAGCGSDATGGGAAADSATKAQSSSTTKASEATDPETEPTATDDVGGDAADDTEAGDRLADCAAAHGPDIDEMWGKLCLLPLAPLWKPGEKRWVTSRLTNTASYPDPFDAPDGVTNYGLEVSSLNTDWPTWQIDCRNLAYEPLMITAPSEATSPAGTPYRFCRYSIDNDATMSQFAWEIGPGVFIGISTIEVWIDRTGTEQYPTPPEVPRDQVEFLIDHWTYEDLPPIPIDAPTKSCADAAATGGVDALAAMTAQAINDANYDQISPCLIDASVVDQLREFESRTPLTNLRPCKLLEAFECQVIATDGETISIDINSGTAGELITGAHQVGGGM